MCVSSVASEQRRSKTVTCQRAGQRGYQSPHSLLCVVDRHAPSSLSQGIKLSNEHVSQKTVLSDITKIEIIRNENSFQQAKSIPGVTQIFTTVIHNIIDNISKE